MTCPVNFLGYNCFPYTVRRVQLFSIYDTDVYALAKSCISTIFKIHCICVSHNYPFFQYFITTLFAKQCRSYRYMHRPDSDLDLLQQFTIYEAVLAYEDGDDVCRTRTIDPSIRYIVVLLTAL